MSILREVCNEVSACYDCMDAGGTIPWMESVESSREQRPRVTQEQLPRMSRTADPIDSLHSTATHENNLVNNWI